MDLALQYNDGLLCENREGALKAHKRRASPVCDLLHMNTRDGIVAIIMMDGSSTYGT